MEHIKGLKIIVLNVYMTIKHLVISGGGPLCIRYLGCLKILLNESYITMSNIENIYCTSSGSLVATALALRYNIDIIQDYFINRPWHEVFKISPLQVLEYYKSKGVFSKHQFELFLSPLLKGKDLDPNITLKDFYEYSKIHIHFNCVEMNDETIQPVSISHTNFPDLPLKHALQMTSSIPFLIEPLVIDNKLYIDGGLLTNYTSNICLEDGHKEEECLGLWFKVDDPSSQENDTIKVNTDLNLFHFFYLYNYKINQYLLNLNKPQELTSQIKCVLQKRPMNIEVSQEILKNKELRKTWWEDGENDAKQYLNSRI